MQQMNAIAPGGIASMMRGMPQGMPQPKPQPAGIALSSINEIANAQGTKTVPEGLKPLLALEQALSQVKAAQNQQALQQQIPQGTIQDQMTAQAEQTLQQARGVSPQQMAPQVAGASQQQEQQKQAVLNKLASSGVAQMPGAQKLGMYAGGGIVAFQDGGLTKGYDRDYMDARRFGIDLSPYDSPEKRAEKLERVRKMREFEKYMKENRAEIPREEPPVSPDTPEAEQQRLLGRFPAPQAEPPALPRPPQGKPSVAPPSGPGILGALKKPVIGPQAGGVAPGLGSQAQGPTPMQGVQPMAMPEQAGPQIPEGEAARRMEEELAGRIYAPSEERLKPMREEISRLQQGLKPKETTWYERLGALAPYLAQQRIDPGRGGIAGGLGRIAMAGQQMTTAQTKDEEARRKQLYDLQTKLGELQQGGEQKKYEAGLAAKTAAEKRRLEERQVATGEREAGTRAEAVRTGAIQAELDRASREKIANLDASTRSAISKAELAARQNDMQAQRDIQRINAALKDPQLEQLAKMAAASPTHQKRYDDALKASLRRAAPDLFKEEDTGGAKPAANPKDPLGIR
jgi:hypothetical protein